VENSLFADKEYKNWIKELKARIRNSQIKAAVRVNSSMLELYWSIGADIVNKQAENGWGSGVINQVSKDLRGEFPDAQGFSVTNLELMKRFFLFYSRSNTSHDLSRENPIPYQLGTELDKLYASTEPIGKKSTLFNNLLVLVPWRHHVEIIRHCETLAEAIFYVSKTAEEGWSRSTLIVNLKSSLFSRCGNAPNNFASALPEPQSELAGDILKDPYNFDFIALREKYVERELEDALIDNVAKLLLELGQGFAFLGRQVSVMAGSKELFIDLLFYHVNLHCYVVVELKAVEFDAAFMGQLGVYVEVVNQHMKKEIDNPTIGLLICMSKDSVYAEYSLKSSSQPIGISAYELAKTVPDEFKSTLPSIAEIEATLQDA